jgi:hypothetical protein
MGQTHSDAHEECRATSVIAAEQRIPDPINEANQQSTVDAEAAIRVIRAVQAEVLRHDFSEFMQTEFPHSQIGCSTCRVPIRPATFPHFLKHLTEDVIPAVVRTALNSSK